MNGIKMTLTNNFRDEYLKSLLDCLSFLEKGDSLRTVVAIATYEEWEERILRALGKEEGEEVILSVKRRALERERELGLFFFDEQVNALSDLRRVRALYPISGEFDPPRSTQNLDQRLYLSASDGELLDYHLIASVMYGGNIYLELVAPDNIKTRRRLFYYRLDDGGDVTRLTLVEDDGLHKTLSDVTDNLL